MTQMLDASQLFMVNIPVFIVGIFVSICAIVFLIHMDCTYRYCLYHIKHFEHTGSTC